VICRVKGFDHSPFDEKIADWHTHYYPYKLGSYKKQFVSDPICVATIDYNTVATDMPCSSCNVPLRSLRKDSGPALLCHGVAIWVDYDLIGDSSGDFVGNNSSGSSSASSSNHTLVHCIDEDFPLYYACNVKFFPSPIEVPTTEDRDHGAQLFLRCGASFALGDSDFKFAFDIHQ
jgi:hypothetical protein